MTLPSSSSKRTRPRVKRRRRGEKHVVVIWLFNCLALVVKVLGRGYKRSGSCQKLPESGYPDRPDWESTAGGERRKGQKRENVEEVNK